MKFYLYRALSYNVVNENQFCIHSNWITNHIKEGVFSWERI